MLSPICREFQGRFVPGRGDDHRARCAACDAWAERLETTLAPPAPREVPGSLQDRLKLIAREEPCRWVEEAWPELLEGELPDDVRDRLEAHRSRCLRCAELLATLGAFVHEIQQPLPAALQEQLRALPDRYRRRPPVWIREARYAAAASYLLAVLAGFVMGNPVAAARQGLEPIRQNAASAWVASTERLRDDSLTAWQTRSQQLKGLGTDFWKTARGWSDDLVATWTSSSSDPNDESSARERGEETEKP